MSHRPRDKSGIPDERDEIIDEETSEGVYVEIDDIITEDEDIQQEDY